MQDYKNYFNELKKTGTTGTEHTYRTNFENFLNAIKPDERIKIIHEPKREKGFGAPDFRIERNGAIIGYIEAKKLDENLDKVRKSKQIKKYLNLCDNLILTNYHEFMLFKSGEDSPVERANLFYLTDVESRKSKLDDHNTAKTENLFKKFFLAEPMQIADSKKLAIHLAERGRVLKDYIYETLKQGESDNFSRKIGGLFKTFRNVLVDDLKEEDFADAYAQTVIYGFFLARLQSDAKITLDDASRLVPRSFVVIKELFSFISGSYSIPNHIRWIFSEIINLINNIDLAGIYKSLSFRKRDDEETSDPYLYFYETFLGEFDAAKRKSKGVYYTPSQVVSFITRSVNQILMSKFNKGNGFAHPTVTVLDFATGTGTFLVAIFELVLDAIQKHSKGELKSLVSDHLLKNFYGFEYLVAPYAVAHLKLSQLLKDYGYELEDDQRLQIYLTDTLDDSKHKENYLFPVITEEGEKANKIKVEKPILVITGNPPYFSRSQSGSKWVTDYKPNGEKNIQPLHDFYIKFIRFAHKKMENVDQGVIGIITNNSFLDGLIHRQMRNKLMEDFDEIYILNLHGNARIGETHPDGGVDENVFDIMQGVSINIFVRNRRGKPVDGTNNKPVEGTNNKPVEVEKKTSQVRPQQVFFSTCEVFYYDLYGTRQAKYKFLQGNQIDTVDWERLDIQEFNREFRNTKWGKDRFKEDLSFFVPTGKIKTMRDYGDFWGINDIFEKYKSGIQTGRDDLFVQLDEDVAENIYNDMKELNVNEFKSKYHFNPSDGWGFETKFELNSYAHVTKMNYRPFDLRELIYSYALRRNSNEIMRHFFKDNNLGLCFIRNDYGAQEFDFVMVTDKIIDIHFVGGQSYIAPLYLYEKKGDVNGDLFLNGNNNINKSVNFTDRFRKFIKLQYPHVPNAREIFGYIYAVMHCPTYRQKYLEFLKIDFPRIPFIRDMEKFMALSRLGRELIEWHLMRGEETSQVEEKPVEVLAITFPESGDDVVTRRRFVVDRRDVQLNVHQKDVLSNIPTGKVYINKTQYFGGVPKAVWKFQIGGYQVLDKWLKYRKDRELSYSDKEHFKEIVNILWFTIHQMERIDEILKEEV
jgi:predicted helicase